MYERFTDRARKVMQLANQEAQRFNHEFISVGHVLAALLKVREGVAGHTLETFGFSLFWVRDLVENHFAIKTDVIVMGKLPQTPHVKRLIEFSVEESRNLNHNYVGTEHLLLGLLRVDNYFVREMALLVPLDEIRRHIQGLLQAPQGVQVETCNKLGTVGIEHYRIIPEDLYQLAVALSKRTGMNHADTIRHALLVLDLAIPEEKVLNG